jgi:hypothetical protein
MKIESMNFNFHGQLAVLEDSRGIGYELSRQR